MVRGLEQKYDIQTLEMLRAHPLWTLTHETAWRAADVLVRNGFLTAAQANQTKHMLTLEYNPNQDQWVDMLRPGSAEVRFYNQYTYSELDRYTSLVSNNAHPQQSTEATRKLNTNQLPQANRIFELYNTTPAKIIPPIEILVIDKPEGWWMEYLQSTGFVLPLPNRRGKRVMALNGKLDHLNHELQHLIIQPKTFIIGKNGVVGETLEECMIDCLRGRMQLAREHMNTLILNAASKSPDKYQKIFIRALLGKPKELFDLLKGIYGEIGLALILLEDPTGGKFPHLIQPGIIKRYFILK